MLNLDISEIYIEIYILIFLVLQWYTRDVCYTLMETHLADHDHHHCMNCCSMECAMQSSSVTILYCNWWRPSRSKRLTFNLFYCYVSAQELPSHTFAVAMSLYQITNVEYRTISHLFWVGISTVCHCSWVVPWNSRLPSAHISRFRIAHSVIAWYMVTMYTIPKLSW